MQIEQSDSFLQLFTHFSFSITALASSHWGTTHTLAPHPKPLYIFTETICSELPQPDFPYQHHSELHGDKASAPTERRVAGPAGPWTESLGGICSGLALVVRTDVSFLFLFWMSMYSFSSLSYWSLLPQSPPYGNSLDFGMVSTCMHNIYDHIGYISRIFWHQSLFTQYVPICEDG